MVTPSMILVRFYGLSTGRTRGCVYLTRVKCVHVHPCPPFHLPVLEGPPYSPPIFILLLSSAFFSPPSGLSNPHNLMSPIMIQQHPPSPVSFEPFLVTICFLYTTFCVSAFLRYRRSAQDGEGSDYYPEHEFIDAPYSCDPPFSEKPSPISEKSFLQPQFAAQFLEEVDRHLRYHAATQGYAHLPVVHIH
jgi:hypothetical protein